MLKIIVGEKGTGKTKTLIDAVHAALDSQKGSIVFINKGTRHTYDLSSKIRLINTEEYAVENYDAFYGVICGVLSQDFDICDIFVDSITKIVGCNDVPALSAMLDKAAAVCEKAKANLTITISIKEEELSEGLKKYL